MNQTVDILRQLLTYIQILFTAHLTSIGFAISAPILILSLEIIHDLELVATLSDITSDLFEGLANDSYENVYHHESHYNRIDHKYNRPECILRTKHEILVEFAY